MRTHDTVDGIITPLPEPSQQAGRESTFSVIDMDNQLRDPAHYSIGQCPIASKSVPHKPIIDGGSDISADGIFG